MKDILKNNTRFFLLYISILFPSILFGQTKIYPSSSAIHNYQLLLLAIFITGCLLAAVLFLLFRTKQMRNQYNKKKENKNTTRFKKHIENLDSNEIEEVIAIKNSKPNNDLSISHDEIVSNKKLLSILLLLCMLLSAAITFAQSPTTKPLITEPGIIITIILISLPILAGIILLIIKLSNLRKKKINKDNLTEAEAFANYLQTLSPEETNLVLSKRKVSLDYQVTNDELSGRCIAIDEKGLVSNVNLHTSLPFVATKKKAQKRPEINPWLDKLICW